MTAKMANPPIADQRPYRFEQHGYALSDPYHWLKDPDYPKVEDPDILAYLKAEKSLVRAEYGGAKGVDQCPVQGNEGANQRR